jgi:organic hydroperoxide reductase OsmC/OhrA
MSATTHHYRATIDWTGAKAGPAKDYKTYSREFTASVPGKAPIVGSSDPAFLGDPKLLNPEDLLVVSLSTCHMLTYLALAANSKVPVIAYVDEAEGTLSQEPDKNWKMSEVVLRPKVTIAAGADVEKAKRLHERAHDLCFIARSVNFTVRNEPTIVVAAAS